MSVLHYRLTSTTALQSVPIHAYYKGRGSQRVSVMCRRMWTVSCNWLGNKLAVLLITCPVSSSKTSSFPSSFVKPWYAMFRAERLVHMNTSPCTAVLNAMYWMSGWTQQLVWPYIVSGRRVAATRKTDFPCRQLQRKKERKKKKP